MRINTIAQMYQTEIRKMDGSRKTEKEQRVKPPVDRSEISSKGQRLSETSEQVSVLAAQIAGQPDIRTEKIAEVREKIKNGFYDTPDFIEKLADKLLQDFGINGAPRA